MLYFTPARTRTALLLAFMALTLQGCGIKPGQVSSPSGEENDKFPRTYPSESTL